MVIVRLFLAEPLFDIVMETRLAESSSFAGAPGGIGTHSVAFFFTDVQGKLNCGCWRGCKLPPANSHVNLWYPRRLLILSAPMGCSGRAPHVRDSPLLAIHVHTKHILMFELYKVIYKLHKRNKSMFLKFTWWFLYSQTSCWFAAKMRCCTCDRISKNCQK